jgi:hypothetical protein
VNIFIRPLEARLRESGEDADCRDHIHDCIEGQPGRVTPAIDAAILCGLLGLLYLHNDIYVYIYTHILELKHVLTKTLSWSAG